MTNFYKPLKKKDIEEKIKLNLKKGMTLQKLRDNLRQELNLHQRIKLDYKNKIHTLDLQSQNLQEQIQIVEDKLWQQIIPQA